MPGAWESSAALYLNELGHVMSSDCKAVVEEASGRNMVKLSLQNKPYPIVPSCGGGIPTRKGMEAGIGGLGFRQSGGFRVAESDEQAVPVNRDLEARNRYSLDVRGMSADHVHETAPCLLSYPTAANFCAWDSCANAQIARRRSALAASARGGTLLPICLSSACYLSATRRLPYGLEDSEYRCRKLPSASAVLTVRIAERLGGSLPTNLRRKQMPIPPTVAGHPLHMLMHAIGNLMVKR